MATPPDASATRFGMLTAPVVARPAPGSFEAYRAGRSPADGPSRCTWYPGMPASERAKCPHALPPRTPRPRIFSSVLDGVGHTPCVRLNRIGVVEGLLCEVVAKCEFFSAGGSVKDRIGLRMIEQAEATGRIKPGDTLIEPTSGNTGIGLALAAALKGYRMIITLPEKMSQEKVDVLKALGAEIIRTPTEAAFDSPESHIGVAARLVKELPNAHILDQYKNENNPLVRPVAPVCTTPEVKRCPTHDHPPPQHTHPTLQVHYCTTAEEIWESCEGKVDMIVCSAGTGGTLTGVARRLKELNPAIIVVGVDPCGSILAEPESMNDVKRGQSYAVEGIGYDFIPTVMDRALVDVWVKTDDHESLIMARRLVHEEGLFAGGSSGSAMCGALAAARALRPDQRCVVVLPDSIRNYMSKHMRDSWMSQRGFVDEERDIGTSSLGGPLSTQWWSKRTVADLRFAVPVTAGPNVTVQQAISLLISQGFDQLPIVGEDNSILGVVTEGNLTSRVTMGKTLPKDPVSSALFKGFCKVSVRTTLQELASLFDTEPFAVVLQTQKLFTSPDNTIEKSVVVGVVTRVDLMSYIMSQSPPSGSGSTPRARAPSPESTSAGGASGNALKS